MSSSVNKDLIAETRRLLDSISSPRPWRHEVSEEHGETVHYGGAHQDAEFIANAPTLISRLLAALVESEVARADMTRAASRIAILHETACDEQDDYKRRLSVFTPIRRG